MSEFYTTLVERPDDALLSDDEVSLLKGGNAFFVAKTLVGLGAVAAYLLATKRVGELIRYEIRGSTLLTSNLIFLSTVGFFQYLYCTTFSGTYSRLKLHRAALYQRFIMNYSFMLENKKKPKIH